MSTHRITKISKELRELLDQSNNLPFPLTVRSKILADFAIQKGFPHSVKVVNVKSKRVKKRMEVSFE